MKIKEVFVHYSYTKNMGNYESARFEAGITSDIEPDEDIEEAFDKSFKIVKKQVKQRIRKGN